MCTIENNENISVCSKCGGKCCKNYAGTYHPSDFGEEITYELLDSAMGSNDIAIDWYEMDDDMSGFFLRPRHVNGGKVDPSWGDTCVHLTPTGCALEFDERPYGCRSLVPNQEGGVCIEGSVEKLESYEIWKPYQDILEKLYYKYRSTDFRVSGESDSFDSLILGIFKESWD